MKGNTHMIHTPEQNQAAIAIRLDYLRTQIEAESISYLEIAELQALGDAGLIPDHELELRQWAGVPEFKEDEYTVVRGLTEIEEPATLILYSDGSSTTEFEDGTTETNDQEVTLDLVRAYLNTFEETHT